MRAMRLLLTAAALFGAVSAQAKSDVVPPLPTYAGAYQPQGVDERGIWLQADEDERDLRDSKAIINDAPLNGYLRDVVCRVVGNERCSGVRIYIVRQADFNATMAPNGMLIVNSGLLLRARNEAELAAVLGHEFAHFELRHRLRDYKHRRTAGDIAAWAGVFAANAGTYAIASAAQSVQITAIGSVYAHSREQEREADLLSLAYLKSSPYDPRCFADIWDRIMDEADATAHGRRQRSKRYDRVAFLASHPATLERATYIRATATEMMKAAARPGEDDRARYGAALHAWRTQFLGDQLKLNDFEGTDYLLGQLAGAAWPADLLFSRGELYRTRGNPRDLVSAVAFYQGAIAQEPGNAEAYRGMGLAQLRSRDPHAADTLRTYLAMRPDATDGAMISTLLQ